MSALSDFSDEDKAKLLDLADRGAIKLYNMPYQVLIEKMNDSDQPIQRNMLFMSLVLAGYADFAASNTPEDDSNATAGQDPDFPASEG